MPDEHNSFAHQGLMGSSSIYIYEVLAGTWKGAFTSMELFLGAGVACGCHFFVLWNGHGEGPKISRLFNKTDMLLMHIVAAASALFYAAASLWLHLDQQCPEIWCQSTHNSTLHRVKNRTGRVVLFIVFNLQPRNLPSWTQLSIHNFCYGHWGKWPLLHLGTNWILVMCQWMRKIWS